MARINLLPWRENLRRQRQRDFGLMLAGGAVISLLALVWWHFHNEGLIEQQQRRNTYLEREIAELNKQIKEIEALERTRKQLIARMNVIQNLQISRPQVVHLFDELVETLPDGVHLTEVSQAGGAVALVGRAQSNARVSAYMRNVERSPWLGDPQLKIIESKDKKQAADGDLNDFRLTVKQQVPKGSQEGGAE
jgi:type IV pilus assembly protein PilN